MATHRRPRSSRSTHIALGILAMLLAAPLAFGAPKKPKKGAKPAAAAPPPEPAPEPPPPPPPEPTPPPAPPPPPPAEAAAPPPEAPKEEASDMNDVTEDPSHKYIYIGLRYRHTILPQALLNAFVDEGQTIHSNSIALELDVRKDGFSFIPWLAYSEFGTGNMLFHEKGSDLKEQYYSMVNSSLKGVFLGADLLWSIPISSHFDFEFGGGAGFGFLFGDLINNWVFADPNGSLAASNGARFSPCPVVVSGNGCDPKLHKNADVSKVGGYVEKSWFGGGSVPSVFPQLEIPIGIRYKPIKAVETRAQLGLSLTGIFFGISGAYGLPDKK